MLLSLWRPPMRDAPIPAATVRHRTAEALAGLLGLLSSREVAALLGCDHSTVLRRGSDLTAWPAADLLTIAATHGALRLVIIRELAGPSHQARPLEAEREVRSTVGAAGVLIGHAMDALRDGRLVPIEAREIALEMRGLAGLLVTSADTLEARARGEA